MRVNRRFLYLGVFFIAIGAVMVADSLYGIDENVLRDAFRLWPLALIAIGVMLVLRRTRLGFAGGMLAAAIPGLALGAAFVLAPNIDFGCGNGPNGAQPATFQSQQGTFSGAAEVDLNLRCGSLTVDTASGSDWSLSTGNTEGHNAIVTSSTGALTVDSPHQNSFGYHSGRDVWRLTVPTASPVDLVVRVDAGDGRLTLNNAVLRTLIVSTNAGDTRADLSGATVQTLQSKVNAGAARLTLPASDFTGSMSVNAGDMRVCTPAGLGVRITSSNVSMGSADFRGLVRTGDGWETPNYSNAAHKAQLTVTVNLGSFTLNPTGGC